MKQTVVRGTTEAFIDPEPEHTPLAQPPTVAFFIYISSAQLNAVCRLVGRGPPSSRNEYLNTMQ